MEEFISINCGEEKLNCRTIFTYHSPLYNKDYYVFQIVGTDDVSVLSYHVNSLGLKEYQEVTDEAEWAMLEKVVNEYFIAKTIENSSCKNCHSGNCKNCHK